MHRTIILPLLLLLLLLAGCGEYTEEEIIQFATQTAKAETSARKTETITPEPAPYPAAQGSYPEPQEAASYPDPEAEPAAVSAYPEPDDVCYQMQFAGKPGDARTPIQYTLTLDKESRIWITEGQTTVSVIMDGVEGGRGPMLSMAHFMYPSRTDEGMVFKQAYPDGGMLFDPGTYEIQAWGDSELLICPFPPDRQPQPYHGTHVRSDGTVEFNTHE
jgi:hypothetical protein